MKELNELIDFYEMTGGEPQLLVMLIEFRRHRMDNWKQRAEAAEAKLAELQKQEPVAYTDAEELESMRKATYADMFTPSDSYRVDPQWIPLFTRPAPAVSLAELVPEPMADWKVKIDPHGAKVCNACRAAMLRNIEEQSK